VRNLPFPRFHFSPPNDAEKTRGPVPLQFITKARTEVSKPENTHSLFLWLLEQHNRTTHDARCKLYESPSLLF